MSKEIETLVESITDIMEAKNPQQVSFHRRTDGSKSPVFAVFHGPNELNHVQIYDKTHGYRQAHVDDIKATSKIIHPDDPEAAKLHKHLIFDKDLSLKTLLPRK